MKYVGCSALMILATAASCQENINASHPSLDTIFTSDVGFPTIRSQLDQCHLKLEITYRAICDRPTRIERSEIDVDLTTVRGFTLDEVMGDHIVQLEGLARGRDRQPISTTGHYYYCDGTSFDAKQYHTWSFSTNSPPNDAMIKELNDYIAINCKAVES